MSDDHHPSSTYRSRRRKPRSGDPFFTVNRIRKNFHDASAASPSYRRQQLRRAAERYRAGAIDADRLASVVEWFMEHGA